MKMFQNLFKKRSLRKTLEKLNFFSEHANYCLLYTSAGPSTLSALLNSLSVGFKTLNIQKNADDISKILGNVKTEFAKFGGLLQTTKKQLNQASNNIDKLLITRTNAIGRALRNIELYEDENTKSVLDLSPLEDEGSNEN